MDKNTYKNEAQYKNEATLLFFLEYVLQENTISIIHNFMCNIIC